VRLILLKLCAGITALLFVVMLAEIARHRAKRRSEGASNVAAMSEYLWAVVPWVMLAAGAFPAVRLIVTGH
jgi:heme/copper-type cytochrome/quinol oxidase subunit 2